MKLRLHLKPAQLDAIKQQLIDGGDVRIGEVIRFDASFFDGPLGDHIKEHIAKPPKLAVIERSQVMTDPATGKQVGGKEVVVLEW